MRRHSALLLAVAALALAATAAPASAFHDGSVHSATMSKLFQSPNATGATTSDLAFWGNRAYVGDYDGFRIFDISSPASPTQLVDFRCHGPQNDPVVYRNKLLFLAVDRTQTGPECGSTDTVAHDDPAGWEGVRIFDVSDPARPRFVTGVYTDCGAHTITMFPRNPSVILLYVSSYPLRPGPTCGEVRGPEAGNSPLHEKISVIRVPVDRPHRARVIAEPKVAYPGDPDNRFDPDEHALPGFGDLTACHDIGVFVQLRLAAAACAEQAQLWRVMPNGIPDTEHPLWVYDDNVDTDGPGGGDVAVDFWHSATFSWDGKIVNFIDESFGTGCPTVTEGVGDTGRMFFLNAATGAKLSHFQLPRPEAALNPQDTSYCSAHLGNVVRTSDRYLLVNAWYTGGVDVVDFTDAANPVEISFYDALPAGATGSDNWSAYWYEGPSINDDQLTLYATHGVESPPTGKGFQVFSADIAVEKDELFRLNPQTQETTLPSPPPAVTAASGVRPAEPGAGGRTGAARTGRHLAP
jgi:hypothetical protein